MVAGKSWLIFLTEMFAMRTLHLPWRKRTLCVLPGYNYVMKDLCCYLPEDIICVDLKLHSSPVAGGDKEVGSDLSALQKLWQVMDHDCSTSSAVKLLRADICWEISASQRKRTGVWRLREEGQFLRLPFVDTGAVFCCVTRTAMWNAYGF